MLDPLAPNEFRTSDADRLRRTSVNSNASDYARFSATNAAGRYRRGSAHSDSRSARDSEYSYSRGHHGSEYGDDRVRRASDYVRSRSHRGSDHASLRSSMGEVDPRWLLDTTNAMSADDQEALETGGLSGTAWESLPAHIRSALLANISFRQRREPRRKTDEQTDRCSDKHRRCRHKLGHYLEANFVQTVLVLMVLVETVAVSGELMIERDFLTFSRITDPCRQIFDTRYPSCEIDYTLYTIFHNTSVTILWWVIAANRLGQRVAGQAYPSCSLLCCRLSFLRCVCRHHHRSPEIMVHSLFELEFILMFYAEGCR